MAEKTGAHCSNCGSRARVVRGKYRFVESGLKNVELGEIELIKCRKCHNVDPVIPRINEIMRILAMALVAKPFGLKGDEVRFLRKYLRMTGEQFSQLLHIDRSTLSKWENDEDPVGHQSDRLIRAVTLALGDGLKEKLELLVRHFSEIKAPADVQILVDTARADYEYEFA